MEIDKKQYKLPQNFENYLGLFNNFFYYAPYSSFLNPIEFIFGIIKKYLNASEKLGKFNSKYNKKL